MHQHRKSIWTNLVLSILISAATGLCTVLVCTALFSAFTYSLMDSMEFSGFFSVVSLICGAASGGYVCGRFRRRRGLAEGFICGVVIYVAMCVLGLVCAGELPGIKRLLLLTAFCAAGGVIGVNSKRPKRLTSD